MFSRPEEVVEYLATKMTTEQTTLGLQFIGKYDEQLIPKYPAIVISANPVEKSIHGTHTFQVELRSIVWVYHGQVTLTHKQRSLADLQLATAIVESLEDDMQMGGNVIHSYVENETPGVVQGRSSKSDVIIGTRLAHWALSQKRF